MKRHLAHALFSLSLCAVMGGVRTAGAQSLDGIVPPPADSASVNTVVLEAAARRVAPIAVGAPLIAATGVRPADAMARANDALLAAPAAPVDWKMPTSRALMIGGASAALIGLAVVGGDTGAIIALSGTAVAVYGLYLHYNR